MLDPGETAGHCTITCVKKMGAKYVLLAADNKTIYQLDDQSKPEAYAARDVIVIGTLDRPSSTIHVADIVEKLPAKVIRASSVYVDCDDCGKGMGKAKQSAIQGLGAWGRFSMATDIRKADIVFLFSANPYLGNYTSGRAADKRPVSAGITYMNVIDPATGASLWSDSRKWGSLFIGREAKALVDEFRGELDANQGLVDPQFLQDARQALKPYPDESSVGK